MRIGRLIASTFLLVGTIVITIPSSAAATNEATAQAAVVAARAAVAQNRKETADVGLWMNTLSHLAKAEEKLEDGDFDIALNEANQAKFEADAGLAQFKEQADLWEVSAKTFFGGLEKTWVEGGSE